VVGLYVSVGDGAMRVGNTIGVFEGLWVSSVCDTDFEVHA